MEHTALNCDKLQNLTERVGKLEMRHEAMSSTISDLKTGIEGIKKQNTQNSKFIISTLLGVIGTFTAIIFDFLQSN